MYWMFKWAVKKAFSLSLSSLMLFSASSISQFSKSCRIRVLHQIMARTQPSISAALPGVVASDDTEMGADNAHCYWVSLAPLFLAEVLALSLKSRNTPGSPSNCFRLLTILKGISELCDWTHPSECKGMIRYRKTAPSTRLWCPCMNGQKTTSCRTFVICNNGIHPRDLYPLKSDSTGKHKYNIAV